MTEKLIPSNLVDLAGPAPIRPGLLAGLFALLYRSTGQSELTIDLHLPRDTTRSLRVTVEGREGFGRLLERVGAELAVFPAPASASRAEGLRVVFIAEGASPPAEGTFDLALAAEPEGEGLCLSLSEDGKATAMWRLAHLEHLLRGAAEDPERPLADLPMLGEEERHQLLVEWNDTAAGEREPADVHDRFEAQVRQRPDEVALEEDDLSVTYAELNRRANALACHLRGMGIGPEETVGLCLERSPKMVSALLGVLKAGGAYLPLDPSHPADRLSYILEDSKPGLLLTEPALRDEPWMGSVRRLVLDGWEEEGAEPEGVGAGFPAGTTPENLAYVIYTSGSTGRPKGVQVTRGGLANFLAAMEERPGLRAREALLAVTTLSFDIAGLELYLPLVVGGRIVLAGPGEAGDAARLAARLALSGADAMQATPATWRMLLDSGWRPERRLRVLCGGEALPRDLASRLLAGAGSLWNLYGPTETTVWSCVARVESADAPLTIGRPIRETGIRILDRDGFPAPVGVAGELCISGRGLARGYLGRPALTAERFVPCPDGAPGERLYRTGDLARYRADGTIEFLGRLDQQVKVRGFRIEPGEIEAALCRHPAVRAAAVVAREDGGEKRLVAYYVVAAPSPPSVGELRELLGRDLPDYMVPASFVRMEALPLTPNGKVDRKALPAPGPSRPDLSTPWAAPRGELESYLVELWGEVLGIDGAGAEDDFFELGGDSIRGALFVNRLQRELGETIYVMSLFEAPTAARYAAYLRRFYPAAVARRFPGEGEAAGGGEAGTVGHAELAALKAFLAGRRSGGAPRAAAARNPPAVFILSPPRAGSTLLRVMLAGHSRLFSPPELHLLGWETAAERTAALSGRDAVFAEGLVRAVMEVEGCDAASAAERLRALKTPEATTRDLYRYLQDRIGGRLLVDKTPTYALDLETLCRAERFFAGAFYIHLARHPVASVRSYLETRLDQVYGLPFDSRRQAELVWLISHENIARFLDGIPPHRHLRLRFEDLVSEPREAMERICRMLGLEVEPGMLRPYEGRRMTDGLHAASRMMGDPRFHEHRGIDASAAERGLDEGETSLGEITWARAQSLGYRRPAPPAGAAGPVPVSREGALPCSFSQERLWLLDRLLPGSAAYNVHIPLRLVGELDTAALRAALEEIARRHEVLRTVFPEVDGRPVQEIASELRLPLSPVDLTGAADPLAEAGRRAAEEAGRPFDLARGPLLRATLLRLGRREHTLLLTVHHIVCDGWSRGLLVRELGVLYEAFAAGRPSPLPEPPVQFADFAVWQRRWLSGEILERQLRFWRERLASPSALELPADRPRPAVPSFRGGERRLPLGPGLEAALREAGRRRRATPFMVLLAAFKALLYRLTGQTDLIVGTPIAGRNRAEIEASIGFFANTLALRTGLDGEPGFLDLVDRVRETALAAYAHQDLPFERLIEELQPERDLSRNPLFQVDFVILSFPVPELRLPGLDVLPAEVDHGTAKFDLTLSLREEGSGWTAGLEYSLDLFEEATAVRLLERFRLLLEAAAAAPETRIGDLPLLAEGEREQLLSTWNGAAAPEGRELLHRLVEEQADRTPDATAVEEDDSLALTYRELEDRANRLASWLRGAGIVPEEPVGVCVERSAAAVVSLLATCKAGGVYLPLDPAAPSPRLASLLRRSGAKVLLTRESLAAGLAQAVPRTLCLDTGWGEVAGESAARPAGVEVPPEALAYLIHTSGSTGEPKAVGVSHGAAAAHCRTLGHELGLGGADRVLQFASLSFDVSLEQIVPALAAGATVVIRGEDLPPPAGFAGWLARRRITVADLPAAYLRQWVAEEDGTAGEALALRLVSAGGEALAPETARRWGAFAASLGSPGLRLVNAYGPTEGVITATLHALGSPEEEGRAVPIGLPLAGRTAHVLDPRGSLAPVGVPGELCLGGLLARGYLGAPDVTAARFVPDPWSAVPGARLYRTGDLARRREDGRIEFLGRLDDQVKLRGFRIELGEVEAALAAHPAVGQAAVLLRKDGAGEPRLAAWIGAGPGLAPGAEEIRAFLEARLPAYMVPSTIAVRESLPLTPAGKVDRRALLALPPEPLPEREVTLPRDAVEEVVAGVWSELLGVERVSVHDNFFALGGHSLKAAQMTARLGRIFGVDLPARVVFEAPTVAGLSRRLASEPAAGARVEKAARLWLQLADLSAEAVQSLLKNREVRA